MFGYFFQGIVCFSKGFVVFLLSLLLVMVFWDCFLKVNFRVFSCAFRMIGFFVPVACSLPETCFLSAGGKSLGLRKIRFGLVERWGLFWIPKGTAGHAFRGKLFWSSSLATTKKY